MITLNIATVDGPESRIIKARAELDDQKLTVKDRRNKVLLTVDAERVEVSPGKWSYGDVLVTRSNGCSCGGTRVIPKT